MLCYGVVQKEGELSKFIADGFASYGYGLLYISKNECYRRKGKRREEVILLSGADMSLCEFSSPDVIVFAPERGERGFERNAASCGAAVIPGEMSVQIARILEMGCAVSYGMSHKDTLTVSSVDEGMVVLSLQREIIDLKNKKIERQEIPVKTDMPPESVMAAAAALLLGGVPISFLKEVFAARGG